jgi:ComF family protein
MLKSFLSLFLQSHCPLCQRSTEQDVCQFCQRQLASLTHHNPHQFWQGDLPLFAWGKYEGKLKQAIAALKYEGHPELADFLGTGLSQAWLAASLIAPKNKITVVPIPLHPKKQQSRGFNQAELIARRFCQVTRSSLASQGLERVKDTPALFALTPTERSQTLKNAFTLGKTFLSHPPQSPILLLDDIYTTGSTAIEAAKVLRIKGLKVIGIVAIATSKKD